MSQAPMSDVTQDDKLWAMLGYIIPLIAIVVLFMEDKKNRPYVKFNAVQSIVATVALTIISTVTLGCGQVNQHMVTEALMVDEFLEACRIAMKLATATEAV